MTNQIIGMMPAIDRARLEPYLESVTLPKAHVLSDPDAASSDTYFLEDGIAMIAALTNEGFGIEAGMLGSEGMADPWVHLSGVRSPFYIAMLSEGHGYRVDSHIVSEIVRESDEMRILFSRYAQTLSIQFVYMALAGACYSIEKRLARWLLMVRDRSFDDNVEFTHATIADQLRVRRQSVTTALHVLGGLGLIQSDRGSVTITSREGLMQFTGKAYGVPEAEYTNLFAEFGHSKLRGDSTG